MRSICTLRGSSPARSFVIREHAHVSERPRTSHTRRNGLDKAKFGWIELTERDKHVLGWKGQNWFLRNNILFLVIFSCLQAKRVCFVRWQTESTELCSPWTNALVLCDSPQPGFGTDSFVSRNYWPRKINNLMLFDIFPRFSRQPCDGFCMLKSNDSHWRISLPRKRMNF